MAGAALPFVAVAGAETLAVVATVVTIGATAAGQLYYRVGSEYQPTTQLIHDH